MTANDLLHHIYDGLPGDCYMEITYILPPELAHVGPSPITDAYRLDSAPDWTRIADMNARGYGVYYSLTAKHRPPQAGHRSLEAEAAWCSVLWVDVDLDAGHFADKDAVHHHLCYMRPVPTSLIDSGGGLHALWRIAPVAITDETRPILKETLRGLAQSAKGDPTVAELARVFRLPGTVNTKPKRDGAICEVLDVLPWQYTLTEFADHRALVRPIARPAPRRFRLPDGVRFVLPGWVKRYLDGGAPEGKRNNTLFGAAVEYRANGLSQAEAERDLLPRALADGLDEREALTAIRSAWRSGIVGTPNIEPHIRARLMDGE